MISLKRFALAAVIAVGTAPSVALSQPAFTTIQDILYGADRRFDAAAGRCAACRLPVRQSEQPSGKLDGRAGSLQQHRIANLRDEPHQPGRLHAARRIAGSRRPAGNRFSVRAHRLGQWIHGKDSGWRHKRSFCETTWRAKLLWPAARRLVFIPAGSNGTRKAGGGSLAFQTAAGSAAENTSQALTVNFLDKWQRRERIRWRCIISPWYPAEVNP